MCATSAQPLAFGPYRIDPQSRRLTRDGTELPLGGRAFDTLLALARAAGETLSKDTLLAAVWPGLVVEENNLQVHISALRKLLGEGWIVTVPNRGYRLVTPSAATPPIPPQDAPPLPDRPSIAVLPFANLGGDPEQEYFADGIAEDILTELSRDRRLFVIGRASSFTFRGAVDLRDVGRNLGVRYVLDGSVRRAGQRLRVSARLNDATTGATVWTDRYDRDTADLFVVQDEIAVAVVMAIGLAVAEAERARVRRKAPTDLTAWEAYQRGLWLQSLTVQEQTSAAIDCFRTATEIDPGFGSAYVAWASAVFRLAAYGSMTFAAAGEEMLRLARRAIECDPGDADAHVMCARAMGQLGDREGAKVMVAEARRLNPASPMLLRMLGLMQVYGDEYAEARRNLREYLRRNPLDPSRDLVAANISLSHYLEGDYEAVVETARREIGAGPGAFWGYRHLAMALGQLGRTDEAQAALATALSLYGPSFAAYTTRRPPFFSERQYAHILEGLRKAGWSPGCTT